MDEIFTLVRLLLPKDRFIIGRNWNGVPISHNILRGDYWIYNEKIQGRHKIDDYRFQFFKFDQLPNEYEIEMLEWRTVDLLNFIDYSTASQNVTSDLVNALITSKLNALTLTEMSQKYGTLKTKDLISCSISRYNKLK